MNEERSERFFLFMKQVILDNQLSSTESWGERELARVDWGFFDSCVIVGEEVAGRSLRCNTLCERFARFHKEQRRKETTELAASSSDLIELFRSIEEFRSIGAKRADLELRWCASG